ncbi:hypothetical protein [Nocardia asteroides]
MPEPDEPDSNPNITAVDTTISQPPSTAPAGTMGAEAVTEESVTGGDDVVSAAQIIVSYLWNSAHERCLDDQPSHIMQQLRTLAHWLTSDAPPD